ncbi:MAG: serine hydrolase domain-containing protein [Bacteroidota bacterium]
MKVQFTLLLFLLANTIWTQNIQERIKNVENGLTFPMTVSFEKEIIKTNIDQRLKENKIYGASVAIVSDGKIEWSKAYGVTEVGSLDRVTTGSLFQCASIGKVITALAALKLVQEGKIDLDEDVNKKLQRWKIRENENTAIKKVTLRHLLSHSAGLTDDYGFLGYDPKDEIPTLLQVLNNDPLANSKKILDVKTIPGKLERYSGGGYLIIQLLIEDISGYSYADYIQQHIFDPLEMTRSNYDYQPDKNLGAAIAAGHLFNGKPLKNKKYNIYPERGAAGPWTTAEDLAKLIIGIQNGLNGESNAILSQDLTQEFLTVQINNKGLGVNLKGIEKPVAFWHAGQNLGYTALLYGLTEKGNGAVVLVNSDGGERFMQEFISSVAHEYDWPIMKAYKSLEIPQKQQTELVGTYVNADQSVKFLIEQKKSALFMKSLGSKKGYQLYKIGNNHYTFKDAQDYYKLSFNFEGNNSRLEYSESVGKTIKLKNIE